MTTKRPSYKRAIEIIALNDEPGITDPMDIAGMISVQLVADLWGKDAEDVALAVSKFRIRLDASK